MNKSESVVRESRSFLHLCHILALLSIHYDKKVDVKNTRGLRTLLRFDHLESAQEFIKNDGV